MDKDALARKYREIHKALCTEIDEQHFEPIQNDPTNHVAWNNLYVMAVSYGCDKDYIALINQCCHAATRLFIGDTVE